MSTLIRVIIHPLYQSLLKSRRDKKEVMNSNKIPMESTLHHSSLVVSVHYSESFFDSQILQRKSWK